MIDPKKDRCKKVRVRLRRVERGNVPRKREDKSMNRSNHTGTCQEQGEVCQSKQEATGLMKIKQGREVSGESQGG
jgi:hypothetical protein